MFLRLLFIFIFTMLVLCSADKGGDDEALKEFRTNFLPAHTKDDEILTFVGFTLEYAEKYEQAKWVAYKLTSKMVDNEGEKRTNNFHKETEVSTGSATPDDYKKSGYDKGHLCPAGDMGWSEETMRESFSMANMSPQLPAFNRGIWKYLETDVRAWTKKENELYIVTGGVLKGDLKTIGNKNKIAVPEYYYKVILDIYPPEYKAIAFVLPNEGSKQSVFEYAVTIDSVEHLTGINFFPALPDSLESNLESHFNVDLWK